MTKTPYHGGYGVCAEMADQANTSFTVVICFVFSELFISMNYFNDI